MSASRCSMTKGASGAARPPRVLSSSARRPRRALAAGSLRQVTRGELGQLCTLGAQEADLDLAVTHARFEARLLEHGGALDHRARAKVEARAMPRAGDRVALT